MLIFTGDSSQDLYRIQLRKLLDEGREISVKEHISGNLVSTKELLDVATVIKYPIRRVHRVPGRNANPFLALSESIWMLAGLNDVSLLAPYNKRILQYSDDGETLYDAYGYRIKDQIPALLDRLAYDPNDRRAILTIWSPEDLVAETKSPPCNDLIVFKLREGKLHMTVFCRSNDLHWGLYAVNLCQFSILQEYLATRLKVNLGYQTHISNSLHIYTEGPAAKITERMQVREQEDLPFIPDSRPLFPGGLPSHEKFVEDCRKTLENPDYDGEPFLEFASDLLYCYRKGKWEGEYVRHEGYFSDWAIAGKEFLPK